MFKDNQLQKHIWIESKYGNNQILNETATNILMESGGVMNGMDDYLKSIENVAEPLIKRCKNGKRVFIFDESIFNFKTFFNTCKITVNANLNNGIESKVSGGYKSGLSGWIGDDYHVEIFINAWGNKKTIIEQIRIGLAHELTHAYDDFGRRNSNADDLLTRGIKDGKYNAARLQDFNTEEHFESIYNILYFCSNTEINGYIGSIKEELRNYFRNNPSIDSKDIYNAITHTQIYGMLKEYEEEINILNQISLSDFDELKKMVIDTYNTINKKTPSEKLFYNVKDRPLTTARQVAKVICRKYNRLKQRFYSNAPRLAYEVYMEQYEDRTPNDNVKAKTMKEELERIKSIINKVENV